MNGKIIKLLNLYYIFTILFYCFGKWNWNIPSYPKLIIYLIICYLCLNLGYRIYDKKKKNKKIYENNNSAEAGYNSLKILFRISSLLLIIFQIAWVCVFLNKFSITNVFETLGSNYYERLNTTFESTVFIMQLRTITWGLTFFSYPIGFLYFKQMKTPDRVLLFITIITDCLAALNMGVSKNIGDIAIISIAVLFLSGRQKQKHKKESNKSKRITVCLLLLFLILFGKIQDIRSDYKQEVINPYGNFATINEMTPYYVIFGQNSGVSKIIDKIGGYTSNSYTGLAYALETPYENTYLIGASRALMEYAEQYLHINVRENTYNYRIEKEYGWKDGQWWPTAMVWMANSVSFYGVPIVLLFIGMFIRKLEIEYMEKHNIISAVVYGQLLIMLFYLPCNMQILQSRQALMGFILLLILYLFRNKIFKSDKFNNQIIEERKIKANKAC